MIRSQNDATAGAQRSAVNCDHTHDSNSPVLNSDLLFSGDIQNLPVWSASKHYHILCSVFCAWLMGCCSRSQSGILNCPHPWLCGAWKVSWSAPRFKRWICVCICLWLLFGKLTISVLLDSLCCGERVGSSSGIVVVPSHWSFLMFYSHHYAVVR